MLSYQETWSNEHKPNPGEISGCATEIWAHLTSWLSQLFNFKLEDTR